MLNRRILRVKAMQALYSYYTTQESLKDVVKEQLESQFFPDPAKDDFIDADKFAAKRKLAAKLFLENLQTRAITDAGEADKELKEAALRAIEIYYSELSKERKNVKSAMLGDVNDLHKLYFKLLALILEFSHIEKVEKEKKEKAHINRTSPWRWHFINNPMIDALTKLEPFTKEIINLKISWSNEYDQIRTWYKEVLQKDEVLVEYQHKELPTMDDHKAAVLHLYKKIIFKHDSINEYLSESDIRWSENKAILKSLVVKTFQDFEADLDPPYELKEVNKNEAEDMEFFEILFDETLRNNRNLDDTLEKKIKNWDISRVALMDRIILKMAITEMIQFHSIPVKVSINEFIEISKQYSTPKSKQFVNGILDVLANELTSDGVIRKSGRGLIDNK